MTQRWLVIIVFVLSVSGISFLVMSNIKPQQQYYLTLSELMAAPQEFDGHGLRLNAKVKPGSIRKTSQRLGYDFVVTDGHDEVSVHYEGMVSDMFQDGVEVVIEGTYHHQQRLITAEKLFTKCPSKYQAEQPPDA